MTNLKGLPAHESRQCFWDSDAVINPLPERIYTIFVFIFGAIFFMSIYGNIGQLVAQIYRDELHFRKRMEEIDRFSRFHHISWDLQNKIRRYVEFQWAVTKDMDIDHSFGGLPQHLRLEVKLQLNKAMVASVEIFADCQSSFFEELVAKLTPCTSIAGDPIFYAGEHGGRMFFIQRGVVHVQRHGHIIKYLGAGDYFGELALLNDAPRSTDVIAGTDLVLFALTREDFETVSIFFPESRRRIEELAQRRLSELKQRRPSYQEEAFAQRNGVPEYGAEAEAPTTSSSFEKKPRSLGRRLSYADAQRASREGAATTAARRASATQESEPSSSSTLVRRFSLGRSKKTAPEAPDSPQADRRLSLGRSSRAAPAVSDTPAGDRDGSFGKSPVAERRLSIDGIVSSDSDRRRRRSSTPGIEDQSVVDRIKEIDFQQSIHQAVQKAVNQSMASTMAQARLPAPEKYAEPDESMRRWQEQQQQMMRELSLGIAAVVSKVDELGSTMRDMAPTLKKIASRET